MKNLLRLKPFASFDGNNNHDTMKLKRCLSGFDLTLLGIGAIIGAGIFVLTGIAAATKGGPAIVLSYVVAGLACAMTALSYAELAASIGGCGSAYGYAYVGLGELIAWIIGWDLILEYGISVPTVAVGWSHYLHSIFTAVGVTIPVIFLKGPTEGGMVNLPASFIVLIVMGLLAFGVKTSARFNNLMVAVKILVLLLFIIVAASNINPSNWHPFMPFGWGGVMSGAALIFFAYIGFDAVSTAAEEVINPQRNLPFGILGSLVICTFFYIVVAGLLTGMVPYYTLNTGAPISDALLQLGYRVIASISAVGAIAGLTTVILVMYYGLSRVFLAMARDQLLPKYFSKIDPQTHTPIRIILITGFIMAIFAGLVPIHELAEMVNIGTLAAFMIVCAGVIILRYTKPDLPRTFKTPFSPITPILGMTFCGYLMYSLPLITWLRFFVWMVFGLVIYSLYSRRHSLLKITQDK